MKLNTLIVDDEPLGRQALLDLCAAQADVNVIGTCDSGGEAISVVQELQPDLLLLDVQMRPTTGLEVAKSLLGPGCPHIVFVTAFDSYAVRAFELNALDYLLKPVEPGRFAAMVERLRRSHALSANTASQEALRTLLRDSLDAWRDETQGGRLAIEHEGRVQFIDLAQIDCAEAHGNYVALHVGERTHTVRATLSEFESRLPQKRFLRLHRSIIVNVARIRSMERTFCGEFDVVLENRLRFRTGRTYRRQIQDFLLRTRTARA